jgi:ABC-2 type transport system permease protein
MSGWFSFRRMSAVLGVEAKQVWFDRAALFLIFGMPILQLLLYGYAVNLEPKHVNVAIACYPGPVADRAQDAVERNPAVHLIGPIGAPGQARLAVKQGRAVVGLELAWSNEDQRVEADIVADASDPATVRPAVAALQSAIQKDALATYAGDSAPVLKVDWMFAPEEKPSWATAPGLVGVIVMVTMLFLGALSLVRERERGTWETLLATPIRPAEALVGKLTPYLAIGLMQTVLLLGLTHLLFDVPLPLGSLALILLSPILGGTYLLLGFTFSALAQTQIQAVQASVGVYLPSLLLSGFLFPFDGMPDWAKAIGECLPLTHYIRASRQMLLRGDSMTVLWPQVWPILVFAAAALALALAAYRRRLD